MPIARIKPYGKRKRPPSLEAALPSDTNIQKDYRRLVAMAHFFDNCVYRAAGSQLLQKRCVNHKARAQSCEATGRHDPWPEKAIALRPAFNAR
jgi:hypothetical protein